MLLTLRPWLLPASVSLAAVASATLQEGGSGRAKGQARTAATAAGANSSSTCSADPPAEGDKSEAAGLSRLSVGGDLDLRAHVVTRPAETGGR